MNEARWLTSRAVGKLFEHIWATASPRKTRLLGCACLTWIWKTDFQEPLPEVIRLVESYADGLVKRAVLRQAADEVTQDLSEVEEKFRPFPRALGLVFELVSPNPGDFFAELQSFVYDFGVSEEPGWERLADMLRDVFGNPFRLVSFDPEWRSDTALSLAKHIYEARDFSTMPILADALQDAGCDNADILSHCREPGTHVGGCWVVDHVLGKE